MRSGTRGEGDPADPGLAGGDGWGLTRPLCNRPLFGRDAEGGVGGEGLIPFAGGDGAEGGAP